MLRYNADKIKSLISELRKSLERLQKLGNSQKLEFLEDRNMIDSSKYNFVIAIESLIDICHHIISQNSFRAPKDYSDTFQVLFDEGAFDERLLITLKSMAKFRNRLVHIY